MFFPYLTLIQRAKNVHLKKKDPTLRKECIYHSRNKKKIWTEIEMTLTSNTDCLNLNYFLMKM